MKVVIFGTEIISWGFQLHVVVPLYKAARDAFMAAIGEYKRNENLSDAFGNFSSLENGKSILSKKQHMSMFIDELLLSALVLSYSPKSEQAWCHRRWVIKMIAGRALSMQEIVGKEFELVEKIAEKSKMNYRSWNHRCWLVSYRAREQVLLELKKSRTWIGLHVADNSCFHYRAEELHWNEELIKQYVGREALWLYCRFLSLCWTRHFATNHRDVTHQSGCKSCMAADINFFLDIELSLVNSCSTIPDNDYEDFQAQAIHSATYILWLTKQIPESLGIELKKRLNAILFMMLNVACPERSSLWQSLAAYTEASRQWLNEEGY